MRAGRRLHRPRTRRGSTLDHSLARHAVSAPARSKEATRTLDRPSTRTTRRPALPRPLPLLLLAGRPHLRRSTVAPSRRRRPVLLDLLHRLDRGRLAPLHPRLLVHPLGPRTMPPRLAHGASRLAPAAPPAPAALPRVREPDRRPRGPQRPPAPVPPRAPHRRPRLARRRRRRPRRQRLVRRGCVRRVGRKDVHGRPGRPRPRLAPRGRLPLAVLACVLLPLPLLEPHPRSRCSLARTQSTSP